MRLGKNEPSRASPKSSRGCSSLPPLGPCWIEKAGPTQKVPPGLEEGDVVGIYRGKKGLVHSATVNCDGTFTSKNDQEAENPNAAEGEAFDEYKGFGWCYKAYSRNPECDDGGEWPWLLGLK